MPDIYWGPLLIALVCFLALWPISLRLHDVSIVDFVWAPGFAIQLALAIWLFGALGDRGILIAILIAAWVLRLSFTLIRRRLREGREDARYTDIRQSWGPAFWWKSIFIVFGLQAIIQWAIAVGAIAGAVATGQSIGFLAFAGAAIALAGIVIETVADRQLDHFKRDNGPGSLLTTGLRKYIRYPNYAGDIAFWAGIGLIGLDGGAWLALISPVLIAVFAGQGFGGADPGRAYGRDAGDICQLSTCNTCFSAQTGDAARPPCRRYRVRGLTTAEALANLWRKAGGPPQHACEGGPQTPSRCSGFPRSNSVRPGAGLRSCARSRHC